MQELKDLEGAGILLRLATIVQIPKEIAEEALLHLPILLIEPEINHQILAASRRILEAMVRAFGYELDLACISDVCLAVQGKARNARDDLEFFGLVHVEIHRWVEEGAAMLIRRAGDSVADHVLG